MAETKQQWHKLHSSVGSGEDKYGEYDLIPLAMLRGGEAKPFKVYRKPRKHLIVDQSIPPRGWYKSKVETSDRVRPRPCYAEALLTTPYGGFCPVNCAFCYVNNGSRGYRATGVPTADPGYVKKFAKRFSKMMVSGAGYISSFTEPFHELESTYHITQELSQLFVDNGLPLFYCTRQIPDDWAVDFLLENPYSYIQWSVNTSNYDDYRRLSPGAADIDNVLSCVSKLADLDVYTSFQCNPIVPGITTLGELVDLVRIAANAGLDHILFKFVEQVSNARKVIIDRMIARGLGKKRTDIFESLFNQVLGGVYTIQQDVRVEWLAELLSVTRGVGITMSMCYEYYDDGRAGANMAPWFTTADQCHGRGVPVFYRPEPGADFQPFPCYRKGCLYCGQYGTQACDNDTLLMAGKLEYKHLRTLTIEAPDDGWDWDVPESCAHPDDARYDDACNPGLVTDAELWEWPKLDEVL